MEIAAVKVMGAGKSGLEALPWFVKEFKERGYRRMSPLGLDHDQGTIRKTLDDIKRVVGEDLGDQVCRLIQMEGGPADNLLNTINPEAYAGSGMADNPARIGAWCRVELQERCNETLQEWIRYSREHRTDFNSPDDLLLVVVPYCPEGPTSGTIGMYLGAMLRKTFDAADWGSRLLVCGVELCPPIVYEQNKDLGLAAANNLFRGYVARQEMMRGVPTTANASDTEYRSKCFDVNLVFDGGAELGTDISIEGVWPAMDRAAAQATALLFKGAASNGDIKEGIDMLKWKGGRWELNLMHVVSDREYSPAVRCHLYRRRLPWNDSDSIQKWWHGLNPEQKRQEFIRSVEEMENDLRQEKNDEVKHWFNEIKAHADRLSELKPGRLDKIPGGGRKHAKAVQNRLETVRSVDQEVYDGIQNSDQAGNENKYPDEPYCVNVRLSGSIRRSIIEGESPDDIASMVGPTGRASLQNILKDQIARRYLKRGDCDHLEHNSHAFFEQITIVSVMNEDASKPGENPNWGLCPPDKDFKYCLSREHQGGAGSFGTMKYAMNAPLYWKPRELSHDIPVEYSILVAARVREQDGFKDVYNYQEMREHHDGIAARESDLKLYHHYYGIRPPQPGEDLWAEPAEQAVDDDEAMPLNAEQGTDVPPSNGNEYRQILQERGANGVPVTGSKPADGVNG